MLEHSNAVFFQKSRGGSEVPKSSSDPDFYCYVKTKAEKNAFKQQKQSKISAKKQSKTTNESILLEEPDDTDPRYARFAKPPEGFELEKRPRQNLEKQRYNIYGFKYIID